MKHQQNENKQNWTSFWFCGHGLDSFINFLPFCTLLLSIQSHIATAGGIFTDFFVFSSSLSIYCSSQQWKTQVITFLLLIDDSPLHKKLSMCLTQKARHATSILKLSACTHLSSVYHFQYFRNQSPGLTAYNCYAIQFSGLGCSCISNYLVTYPQVTL